MATKSKSDLVVGNLGDIPDEDFLPTGIPEVDELLGGGFPRRRITQIFGVPGVGKSYLLARTMANLMKDPKSKILYVDAEFALNRARLNAIGVPVEKVDYIASSELEKVAEYVVANIQKYDLVIIDTLAKLTPMTVMTNEVGQSAIGLVARQISHFEAKLRPKLYASKAAFIGINQVRANMGMGPVQTQAFGGWSWGHAVDLSLKLAKPGNNPKTKTKDGVTRQVGHMCKVTVDKSRIGGFKGEVEFLVEY